VINKQHPPLVESNSKPQTFENLHKQMQGKVITIQNKQHSIFVEEKALSE